MDRRERIYYDEKTKKFCIEQRENGDLVAIHFYDSISEELMPLVRYIPIAPITPADNPHARQSVQTSGAPKYENEDSLGEFVITDRTVWVGVVLVSLVILATAAPMIIQTITHIADLSIVMAEKAVEAILALLKLIGYLIAAGLVLFFLYMVVKLWLSDKPPPPTPPAKATDKTRVTVVVGVEVDKL